MSVVFPDPRKPVTIVIGVGMAFAETGAAVPVDPGAEPFVDEVGDGNLWQVQILVQSTVQNTLRNIHSYRAGLGFGFRSYGTRVKHQE